MLISRDKSLLLIVDVQEKLVSVMAEPRRVIHNGALLMRAAARLGVPVVVSEQYPKGIGPTIFDLREYMPAEGAVEKLHFSCAQEPEILRRLTDSGRRQVVIAGIEAHVCVLQTALDLLERGFEVFVVVDACSSRRPENEALARERLAQAGVSLAATESVLFEWLGEAGTPEFKELMPLIK